MRAYRLTVDQVELFFEVCAKLNATTEAERTQILETMAEFGQVQGITHTKMGKEDYLKHLAKHFGNVLSVESKTTGSIGFIPNTDDQPKGE